MTTSIESLWDSNREECICVQHSFDTALERNGLSIAYLSFANPLPEMNQFYSGDYITENYISRINTIQTELPNEMRTSTNRADNARRYAEAIVDYII